MVDWSPEVVGVNLAGYVQYRCHSCHSRCLNHHTESCTRYRECERCHAVPVLDRGEPVDQILADLRWAAHAILVESSILDDLDQGDRPGEDDLGDDREVSPPTAGQRSLSDFDLRADGGR